MKLENQVCTLGQAKRLKELGVMQDSYFSWSDWRRNPDSPKWMLLRQRADEYYSAFTVAELGVMLPEYVGECFLEMYKDASNEAEEEWFLIRYYERDPKKIIHGYNQRYEAHARASMLIWLLENGHIPTEEANARLAAS